MSDSDNDNPPTVAPSAATAAPSAAAAPAAQRQVFTNTPLQDRCLALGALVGCAIWVHRLAEGAKLAPPTQNFLLMPTLARDSNSVTLLLPPSPTRQDLLAQAKRLLRGSAESARVLGYLVELIELANRLGNHQPVVANLADALDQLTTADPTELATVYQHTISTLGRRIQVRGDAQTLQQESTAALIRAMLLAGVRYAWLWHQLGGRRWHLLLKRSAILNTLGTLESQPNSATATSFE